MFVTRFFHLSNGPGSARPEGANSPDVALHNSHPATTSRHRRRERRPIVLGFVTVWRLEWCQPTTAGERVAMPQIVRWPSLIPGDQGDPGGPGPMVVMGYLALGTPARTATILRRRPTRASEDERQLFTGPVSDGVPRHHRPALTRRLPAPLSPEWRQSRDRRASESLAVDDELCTNPGEALHGRVGEEGLGGNADRAGVEVGEDQALRARGGSRRPSGACRY